MKEIALSEAFKVYKAPFHASFMTQTQLSRRTFLCKIGTVTLAALFLMLYQRRSAQKFDPDYSAPSTPKTRSSGTVDRLLDHLPTEEPQLSTGIYEKGQFSSPAPVSSPATSTIFDPSPIKPHRKLNAVDRTKGKRPKFRKGNIVGRMNRLGQLPMSSRGNRPA
ncbi:hypothetical protein C8R44DRAFT_846965 [Mycena epipterygia]|nr:hypothetical protein C8R44DRAFT_846965 [Mycena epipterygia]